MSRVLAFRIGQVALAALLVASLSAGSISTADEAEKPNILVTWSDDIGVSNVSAYHQGMMGGRQGPFERAIDSKLYTRWWADKMWTMVPAQVLLGAYLESLKEFPPTRGSSLSIDKVLEKLKTQKAGQ